jgi:hypothetical protein
MGILPCVVREAGDPEQLSCYREEGTMRQIKAAIAPRSRTWRGGYVFLEAAGLREWRPVFGASEHRSLRRPIENTRAHKKQ